MRVWLIALLCVVGVAFASEEEKIIHVPNQLTVDMILSDQNGYLNGSFFVRARLYDSINKALLWYQDFENYRVVDGSVVLTMNELATINEYDLHLKSLLFVVSIDDQSVEIPLLTHLYAYRSKFSEFGWDTRFPSIFNINRNANYVGIGNPNPKAPLHVGGGLKLGFEDTVVTGAIAWRDQTLKVKHPNGWVDLLYGPTTFKKSRWNAFSSHIQLASANYSIGIGVTFPQEQLHVGSNGLFSGNLRALDIQASSMNINTMSLNSVSGLYATELRIADSNKQLDWNRDSLRVPHGQVNGNGEELTHLGAQANEDGHLGGVLPNSLQSHHIDTNTIGATHFQLSSIFNRHLGTGLGIDKFNIGMFDGDRIAENAIASDNILPESLTIDLLENNNLSEFIPDGIFGSDKIEDNSVYNRHFGQESIASFNIISHIFGADQLAPNTIDAGRHIVPNAVSASKIKAGEIGAGLFSGVLPTSQGGTGITSLSTKRVIRYDSLQQQFDPTTNMHIVFDDAGQPQSLGIADQSFLNELELGHFQSPLTLFSRTGSANARIETTTNNTVGMRLKHPLATMDVNLQSNGYLQLALNQQAVWFHEHGLSFDAMHQQHQLHVGGAVTIGDTSSSQPVIGTMEYESDANRFRFYMPDGATNEWHILNGSVSRFGIGAPLNLASDVHYIDSFIGQLIHATGTSQASRLLSVDHSTVSVNAVVLDRLHHSHLDATATQLGTVSGSTIHSQDALLNRIASSTIRVSKSHISKVDASNIHAQHLAASQVQSSRIRGKHAHVRAIQDVDATIAHSELMQLRDSHIQGSHTTAYQSHQLFLTGDSTFAQAANRSRIIGNANHATVLVNAQVTGNANRLTLMDDATVNGNNNQALVASDAMIFGDSNRVLGHHQRIRGTQNTVIGDHVVVNGDQNIVIQASKSPIRVDGNQQVVMAAPNGVQIHTGDGMVVAANQTSGGWMMVSDEALKENFKPVDHSRLFQQLMGLPVAKWEYKFNPGVAHIGPMAQEFNAIFNMGEDPRFISATDADGVAFSAIKHLVHATTTIQRESMPVGVNHQREWGSTLDQIGDIIVSLESSMAMKKNALDFMVQNNLKQYQTLDGYFKSLKQLPPPPHQGVLLMSSMGVLGAFFLGFYLGFLFIRRYDNKKK